MQRLRGGGPAGPLISAARSSPLLRAGVIGLYVLAVEWTRALLAHDSRFIAAGLLLGGVALGLAALGWPATRLGLGRSRFAVRVIGGLALGAVLLLPAAARSGAVPLLPGGLAVVAIAVSIGEELAFRGALYAALDELGGAPLAVAGTTVLWTLAHALSHPPEFLGAVAAAGLLLGLWRWACKDLVAPIIGHVIADLAL
ncbi:MAG: CPBP family intramembrane metalloprotease [Chloroflexi bacterium]|nr:MAG: CPBP family intramembrane metalloprotease [Chloroflexota bacterium]TMG20841.1 MAG: CPBP family intramembrane metalloprotease [Chloroflexota bacterium]TMG64169.1 MAG: CPBP family intramembrane metalloprotease [Chloroflexota bacterium]